MDIVILADFCGRFDGKGNNRFLYIADMLCGEHDVEVITSDFNHGMKEYFKQIPKDFSYKITMLHEGRYKKNICLSRFKAHYIWGKNVADYLKTRKKPDVVYCAVPTLKAAYEAAKYCEKNNVKFIVDVQDLWPEAFQMVFNVPVISKMIFFPFKYLADGIYRRANEVIAVSKTYVNRVLKANDKCKNGLSIYLGTNLDTFDNNCKNNPISDKKDNEVWLGYCGTLGSSYDLISVINALEIVEKTKGKAYKFVVMGDGPRRQEFEKYAQEKGVNAEFYGTLPYDEMCGRLRACDIVVNPISKGAAQSIINKHADYAASGCPVLNMQECDEYCNLVEEYEMGYNCRNSDPKDLAEKLLILLENEDLRSEMGQNARKCAEERFDRKRSYQVIINRIVSDNSPEKLLLY